MKNLRIVPVTVWTDCETCGPSYAEGADVFLDGALILRMAPHASCFDNISFDSWSILKKVLEKLTDYKIEIAEIGLD